MAILKLTLRILIVSAFGISIAAAQSGVPFLKTTLGAKETGLSGAGVASDGTPGFISINPSGISSSESPFLNVENAKTYPDMQRAFFQGVYKIKAISFGLSMLYSSDANIIPADQYGRYDPGSPFAWYDFMSAVQIGKTLGKTDIGVNVKGFHQRVINYTRFGGAVDAGIRHKFISDKFRTGFSVLNIGKANQFDKKAYALPLTIKAGLSFLSKFSNLSMELLTDINYLPKDDMLYYPVGLEAKYCNNLYLRAGFPLGKEQPRTTLGAGVRYKKLQFDYGVVLSANDFQLNHVLSITVWNY